VKWIGVTLTLAIVPALSVAGFALLGGYPTVAVLVAFQAVRRATNFALARPTREVLFIVLPREDRYKTKNFIDTFVYRLGDQIGAWSLAALGAAGVGLIGMAWLSVPMSIAWLVNGLWLGRTQERLAAAPATAAAVEPAPNAFVGARS
jgi:AAA family ATP:ADP antiporter